MRIRKLAAGLSDCDGRRIEKVEITLFPSHLHQSFAYSTFAAAQIKESAIWRRTPFVN